MIAGTRHYRPTPDGRMTSEVIFIKDVPCHFENDSFTSVHCPLTKDGSGTFSTHSGMFNKPGQGDLISVRMEDGKILMCVVTSYTQDYIIGKGTLVAVSYKEHYENYFTNSLIP